MVVCDIGQGDGIYIRADNGADLIVDGGPDNRILDCLSKHMPFWDRTIEVMILTNPDADHLRGVTHIIDSYKVIHYATVDFPKQTAAYKLLQSKLRQKNITTEYYFSGEKIIFGKTEFSFLWPDKSFNGGTVNDNSVVGRLTFGNFSALLTGDVGANILDTQKIGKVNVLKVPHHGSKTGMSDIFLNETMPNLAIISVGKHNNYGHPASLSLELLKKHNVKTLRTDLNGEVEVVSDGNSYWVN